jgi:hypothetical protein
MSSGTPSARFPVHNRAVSLDVKVLALPPSDLSNPFSALHLCRVKQIPL